jgi:hypothetical protein
MLSKVEEGQSREDILEAKGSCDDNKKKKKKKKKKEWMGLSHPSIP